MEDEHHFSLYYTQDTIEELCKKHGIDSVDISFVGYFKHGKWSISLNSSLIKVEAHRLSDAMSEALRRYAFHKREYGE